MADTSTPPPEFPPVIPPILAQELIAEVDNWPLNTLLFGIYTAVYFYTLYLYTTQKKSPRNWFVIGWITVSYLASALLVGFGWHFNKIATIALVQTLATGVPQAGKTLSDEVLQTMVDNICLFVISAVADGLLVWRCYNVWGRSMRSILVQAILLFWDVGANVSVIIITSITHFSPSTSQVHALNGLIGASFFLSFVTTLLNTALIAYRILSVSKASLLEGSKSQFNHVLEIIIESAVPYTLAALTTAVLTVVPITEANEILLDTIGVYLNPIYLFIAGVTPTIMVARVVLMSDRSVVHSRGRDSTVLHTHTQLSALQFRSAGANATGRSGRTSIFIDTARGGAAIFENVVEESAAEEKERKAEIVGLAV